MTDTAARSVRAYMIGLTLAVVVPLLAFSAFLVMHAVKGEQSLMTSEVRERAQTVSMEVEHTLASVRGRMFALTSSPALQSGDFATFHQLVSDVLNRQGIALVMTDSEGRTIFSTAAPFGAPLPDYPAAAGLRHVASTGLAAVSGLVSSPLTKAPAVLVSVPVVVGGRSTYVLVIDITRALDEVLVRQHLPAGWIATVLDRDGYIVARSQNADQFVGQIGRLSAVARVQEANAGTFPYTSREGVPMENAFTHVNLGGWGVVIGIPRATLLAPVRQSASILALLGACTLALALVLSVLIGRHVSRPIARLVGLAEALGRGAPITSAATGLNETDRVAASLCDASEQLARNATERQQAIEDLRRSGERYRALADALALANQERQAMLQLTVQGQEDERRRIARELHDGFGQYLTALRLGLTAMEAGCQPDSDGPRQLAALKALTDDLGRALGRMAWELRPTALDDLGLHKAIAQYLEEWAERTDLRIDQEVRIDGGRLAPAIETTLFRVVQEAITNVVKHAGAEHVAVILHADGREVRLIIEDNGRGFPDAEAAQEGSRARQLGLLGIRERLALVGGELDIESLAGQGTTLYVRVPLAGEPLPAMAVADAPDSASSMNSTHDGTWA